MSRPLALAAALVALAAVAPAVGAEYVASGRSPWDSGYPLNPQMYCAVVFDEGGEHFCKVQGPVRNVEIVRVRIAGKGHVHVSLVDDVGPLGLPEQRASVDCDRSCVVPIPGGQHHDTAWTMYVWLDAPGPAALQASVEARAALTEDDEV